VRHGGAVMGKNGNTNVVATPGLVAGDLPSRRKMQA
jgi:hypothetical protein